MKQRTNSFELLEPQHPESSIPNSPIESWMLPTVMVVMFVIGILWWVISKKSRAVEDPMRRRKEAYQQALSALKILQPIQARDAAIHCSLILRRFLATVAADPALFETHEEFISRKDTLDVLTAEARLACNTGFAMLASQKYDADVHNESPQDIVTAAQTLLETLNHGFQV
jgi:hypothetical protein